VDGKQKGSSIYGMEDHHIDCDCLNLLSLKYRTLKGLDLLNLSILWNTRIFSVIVCCKIVFMLTNINGRNLVSAQPNQSISSNVLKFSEIKIEAHLKAAANKTLGDIRAAACNTTQYAKSAENKNEHAAKTYMNNTGRATQKFLANLTGTSKQFITGR
jgi:hypothetical protein